MTSLLHAFTVDVEDWYQSSCDFNAPISEVCAQNTHYLLELLSRFNVQGTFFVLGLVAERHPRLIREIQDAGHEVQTHGYSHRPVNRMTPDEFKEDLRKSMSLIENITGERVVGYRAPDFSIDERSFWAFEVMLESGITYDSSIFPIKTARYGIHNFQRRLSHIKTPAGVIEELPVSVFDMNWFWKKRIPVGGGGYFRLFPAFFLRYVLKKTEEDNLPFVLYCHPYEFNPREWLSIAHHVPWHRRLHQGLGRKGFEMKITQLASLGNFRTMSQVIETLKERLT